MTLWLLWKLPAAFFMGVRVKSCTKTEAHVTLPYWWMSRNPFKSIYFAAQCSAAELSTGVLVLNATGNRKDISTLLLSIEASYTRKAITKTTFTCTDGEMIRQAVAQAIKTGESRQVTATSVGKQKDGSEVSRTQVTWSFKIRN